MNYFIRVCGNAFIVIIIWTTTTTTTTTTRNKEGIRKLVFKFQNKYNTDCVDFQSRGCTVKTVVYGYVDWMSTNYQLPSCVTVLVSIVAGERKTRTSPFLKSAKKNAHVRVCVCVCLWGFLHNAYSRWAF